MAKRDLENIANRLEDYHYSEHKAALIIGNSAYAEAPLRNPANDAEDMSAALEKLGFQVELLKDSNRREMRAAVRRFGDALRSGGVGLFYFAGHGIQLKGKNYLVPLKADIRDEFDVEDEALHIGMVLSAMERASNRLNIVILDACRNNPYARSFRSASRGLAMMDAPRGTLIAYSTAPGQVAADGAGRNSPYTGTLLPALQLESLEVEKVFKRVRIKVIKETSRRQVPWESSSLTGDFYFRPVSLERLEREAEAARQAEEERQRKAEAAVKRRLEAERRKAEEIQKRRAEEETSKKLEADKKRQAEAERERKVEKEKQKEQSVKEMPPAEATTPPQEKQPPGLVRIWKNLAGYQQILIGAVLIALLVNVGIKLFVDLVGTSGELRTNYLGVKTAEEMLKKKGFYDRHRNSDGKGINHQYELQAGGEVVYDGVSGLMWQQGGSSDNMIYEDAKTYISRLNQEKFAGYADWRLPTLEEAMSLMAPVENDDGRYIDPVFDSHQDWIWTSDKESASRMWDVSFNYGHCDINHVSRRRFVRAVRFVQSFKGNIKDSSSIFLGSIMSLRSIPEKNLNEKEVMDMLKRKGFYDSFWNDTGKGIKNQYNLEMIAGEKVVTDGATDLMWQQSGSIEYLNYDKAKNYVTQLNRGKFYGFKDWRLPTLEEAMSLMESEIMNNHLYIDPLFNTTQVWIWTSDLNGSSAWYVYFNGGKCSDDHVNGYVRAVRSGKPSQ